MRNKINGRRDRGSAAGSVTVYFVIVTAAFGLFAGVLIDFARVAAFRQQAELKTKAAVRSVLSAYEPQLYARYGLFARGGEAADDVMRDTLTGAASGEGAFPFLDVEWERTDAVESRPLADRGILKRQILEEMKYKAPIDLAIELAGRFGKLTPNLQAAAPAVGVLEQMRDAYDRREAALTRTLETQRQSGERLGGSLEPKVLRTQPVSESDLPLGPVRTIGDLSGRYAAYTADGSVNVAYENGANGIAGFLTARTVDIRKEAATGADAALDALNAARAANGEMRKLAEQMNRPGAGASPSATPAGSGADANAVGDSAPDAELADSLDELRNATADLALDERFFDDWEREIAEQREWGTVLAQAGESLAAIAARLPGSTGLGEGLRLNAVSLQQRYAAYGEAYGNGGAAWTAREAMLERQRGHERERKEQERKAGMAWSGAVAFLAGLSGRGGTDADRESFAQTYDLYRKNMAWNKTEEEWAGQADTDGQETEAGGYDPSADAYDGRDRALASAGSLSGLLGQTLLGVRDQLYFSEYTIGRLSQFEPAKAKAMLDGQQTSLDISEQETEFVLYGFNNVSANIAAAYGEIFAFRLAVRTAEGLMEHHALGHPLLVLAAAFAYGISNALLDLQALFDKGEIPLSKHLRTLTHYTDYLRLFLLAHAGGDRAMSRMTAVMERRSGVSFEGAYTYVSGEAALSVRLWFYPGLAKLLGRAGTLGGTVTGNRYEATFVADSAYQ